MHHAPCSRLAADDGEGKRVYFTLAVAYYPPHRKSDPSFVINLLLLPSYKRILHQEEEEEEEGTYYFPPTISKVH